MRATEQKGCSKAGACAAPEGMMRDEKKEVLTLSFDGLSGRVTVFLSLSLFLGLLARDRSSREERQMDTLAGQEITDLL